MTNLPVPAGLRRVGISGPPEPWAALGFAVSTDGAIGLANGAIATGQARPPWIGVDELPGSLTSADLEGVEVRTVDAIDAVAHPNGALELDHLVLATPDRAETSHIVTAVLGMRRLRVRDEQGQTFHRFADVGATRGCILEIVERHQIDRVAVWGLVVTVGDIDAVAQYAGVGEPRPAVQPGRRIAVVSRDAGLEIAVAFMSPHVRSGEVKPVDG